MMGGAERRLKKEATLNETIGCPRCTYCAAYLPAGSTSADSLYCTYLRMHVEKDDGCRFGAAGTPMRGSNAPQVDTGIDATARGYYSWCAELMR